MTTNPSPPDWRGLCEELTEFVARLTNHYYQPAELLVRARAALAQPEPEVWPTDEELESFLVDVAAANGDIYWAEPLVLARAVLARWGNQPAPLAEADCPACEGVPKPGNQPCAVCGRSALSAEGEVAELALKELERTMVLLMPVTGKNKIKRFDTIRAALKRLQELENKTDLIPAPPAPVHAGDVGELVADLRMMASQAAEACQFTDAESLSRSADLLERQATACAICEWERLHQSTRAADLQVERQAAPVPVSERLPGPGDCDAEGRCWWWDNVQGSWYLQRPSEPLIVCPADLKQIWLSFNALPLPSGEVE